MTKYAESDHCLMQYLRAQLDDPSAERCRRCGPCTGTALPTDVPRPLVAAAVEFLRWQTLSFSCRRQWPYGLAGASARIPVDYRAEDGRALSVFGDAGWGTLVRDGKFVDERFSDELVHALAELVRERWRPNPSPTWVTCVPSWRRAQLVPDVALRLARDLGLPFRAVVTKVKDTRPQKELENSFQQAANVHDAFTITGSVAPEAVLLVDDIVDSRWTLTVVAALLREAGSGAVHPVALADAQPQRS
jgi:ATP-dependent DNA helicase RecQ